MSKIVYLIEQPLDERNYKRFGIQTWIDRGWDVEVWDLTPLTRPGVWQQFIESGRKVENTASHFPVTSKNRLKYLYSRVGKIGHFIDLTGDDFYTIRVKMFLIRIGATRVRCWAGSIPDIGEVHKRSLACKFRENFSKGSNKGFKWLAQVFLMKLAIPFVRPGLVIVTGTKSLREATNSQQNQNALKVHNFDYDLFLKHKESIGLTAKEYAIFIDQDICFHPDYLTENFQKLASPERYFPSISKGLKIISDALEVDMKIAAHPRVSLYQHNPGLFEGIPIENGKTAELISNCKFVVCHYSTAIQLAVMFKKPLVFVTTDEIDSSPIGRYIAKFASIFGKSVIDLDGDLDKVDWHKELHVDFQKYDEYRNKYIKMDGSPEIPFWDIVIDHIEKVVR